MVKDKSGLGRVTVRLPLEAGAELAILHWAITLHFAGVAWFSRAIALPWVSLYPNTGFSLGAGLAWALAPDNG